MKAGAHSDAGKPLSKACWSLEFQALRCCLLCITPLWACVASNTALLVIGLPSSAGALVFDFYFCRRRRLPFAFGILCLFAFQAALYGVFLFLRIANFSPFHSEYDRSTRFKLPARPFENGTAAAFEHAPTNIETMSVVFVAHNEQRYMQITLDTLFERTPAELLWEVIVVDDGSTPPMASVLEPFPDVVILRHESRMGLIKSKIAGGNRATGDMIVFLDAHVKPDWNWAPPLLKHVNANYKRVVVPSIPILDESTWMPNNKVVGYKMMFDWKLSFGWFEDGSDLVPLMSGGLFGITRKWWHESGEYDYGMSMWGAENIEQSIRIWLCGGEIYVARDSRVAHLFRPKFPYIINNSEVYINKIRTVEVWFDEYKRFFYEADPPARAFLPHVGDLSERQALRTRLQCKPFQEYVNKFRLAFQLKGMLPKEMFSIRDLQSHRCVVADSSHQLVEDACVESGKPEALRQRWLLEGLALQNMESHLCMDAYAGSGPHDGMVIFTEPCFGLRKSQHWALEDGQLRWGDYCAVPEEDSILRLRRCSPDMPLVFGRSNIEMM